MISQRSISGKSAFRGSPVAVIRNSAAIGAVILIIAVGVVALLVRAAHLDIHGLINVLTNIHFIPLLILAFAMIAQNWCSSEKWRLIIEHTASDRNMWLRRSGYFAYTAYGMLIGQVVPTTLGAAASRGLGLIVQRRGTALKGMGSTLFEQSFDIMLACFCALATLLTISLRLSSAEWLMATIILAGAGVCGVLISIGWLRDKPREFHKLMSSNSRVVRILTMPLDLIQKYSILQPSLLRRLFTLSVLRYTALIISAVAAAWAGSLAISAWQIAAAMPLVVLAVLMSFVPGGIGVNELTFSSVLTAVGVPFPVAVEFVVLNRVLNVLGTIVVASAGCLVLTMSRWRAEAAGFRSFPQVIVPESDVLPPSHEQPQTLARGSSWVNSSNPS